MGRIWDAEQLVEPNVALRMITEQFPEIQPVKIQLLGAGWDNTAYLVNDALVFRFPRRQIAVPMIETEAHVLPYISKYIPLDIPNPQWIGKPAGDYPWPFIGYPVLKGTTACLANLSDQQRNNLAKPIAKILSVLHSIPVTSEIRQYLPDDLLGRLVLKNLVRNITMSLNDLVSEGLVDNIRPFMKVLEESEGLVDRQGSVIVHGDFYIRHLLVNDQRELAGIIDWGDLHFGDPAVDLAIIHSILPLKGQEAFLKEYGDIDEATWRLAQLRAISSCGRLATYGHHTNDPVIAREVFWGLRQIARAIS